MILHNLGHLLAYIDGNWPNTLGYRRANLQISYRYWFRLIKFSIIFVNSKTEIVSRHQNQHDYDYDKDYNFKLNSIIIIIF